MAFPGYERAFLALDLPAAEERMKRGQQPAWPEHLAPGLAAAGALFERATHADPFRRPSARDMAIELQRLEATTV